MDRSQNWSGEHRLDNLSISGINLSDADGSSSMLGQSRSGPIRVISSLRAHRGPYARPSALDKESRYSPYSRKPMLIRAKKVANEDANLTKLTTTAERIIQTIASCSTPVVSCKRSPIFEKLKTLKPDFPVSPRSGPPTQKSALDTSCTNYSSPVPEVSGRTRAASVEKPQFNAQDLIDDLFPPTGAELEIVSDPAGAEGDENVLPETLFESSGLIKADKLTFEGWSLDKFNKKEGESSSGSDSSSSESEAENETSNLQDNAFDDVVKPVPPNRATEFRAHSPPLTTSATEQSNWECPTCMVSCGAEMTKCPCCETANPNVEAEAKPASEVDSKWECPTCMVYSNASEAECPCCGTKNPDAKAMSVASKSEPTSSPFQFGFKSTPISTTSAVTSSFVFGAKNPEPPSLQEKFKIGFPATSTSGSGNVGTGTPNPPFPSSFSFGFNVAKPNSGTSPLGANFALAGKNAKPKDTTDTVDFILKPSNEEKWECPSCMVYNLVSQSKCQCCHEPQPGEGNTVPATPPKVSKDPGSAPTFNATISFPSMKPIAESTPAPEKPPLQKPSPAPQPEARRKIVFGLKPEDEEDKPDKPNPFCGFVFKSTAKASESETVKPKPAAIEPWTCNICRALNTSGKERCTGCQSFKPKATPAPALPQGESFEHYVFGPKSTVESNKTPVKQPESFSGFGTPATTMQSNVTLPAGLTTSSPGSGFQFGTLPAPVTAAASSTPSFSLSTPTFGTGTPTEGLKRKAVDLPEPGTFNFTSSEPNLKLRATGAGETPTPLPSLKSGSVLDALKQPGFGSQTTFDTSGSTAAIPISTSAPVPFTTTFTPTFSLPTQAAGSTSSQIAPTSPHVFQFGSTTSTPASNPPAAGGFAFGSSASMNTSAPISFGSSASAPAAPGGFRFQPPAASPTPAPFTPPNFSMTPNLNFGTSTFGASAQPFAFQGQTNPPIPGAGAGVGGDGSQPVRRFRKAVRRAPR